MTDCIPKIRRRPSSPSSQNKQTTRHPAALVASDTEW
jgi:hypothetical protein